LAQRGVPAPFLNALASVPEVIGDALGRARLSGGGFTALRLPSLIGEAHRRFYEIMRKLDRVVAPCEWVCEVLRCNGVPEDKLVLCRQGLAGAQVQLLPPGQADTDDREESGVLRLGYFGRLDPMKGIDIVIEAVRRIPHASVRLDIYGIRQAGSAAYIARLERAAAGDTRIEFRPALPAKAVGATMRHCDLVVVPSRCLETGPLVVLEAFAVGTPVLGARLGGIVELVSDGVDGVLIAMESPAVWASAISALAAERHWINKLRAGIRPPRTMDDVARDIARLYRAMLADAAT
jgi:glycosyltransferase involved in cell wall biosynthesis